MTEQTTEIQAVAPTRRPTAVGDRGIEITTMSELQRFAQIVAESGLAPKGLQTPQAILVAIQMGAEVGLKAMASLQNIAVINGRPSLWGDSQLAVVRGTGELEEFSEWYEVGGKRVARNPSEFGDDATAVCRVKRVGMEVSETAFSVADAKRAKLWGKDGPWTQYPARMLRFRARSFGLRDQFGDALRGLRSAEELMDEGDMKIAQPDGEPRTVVNSAQGTALVFAEPAPLQPAAEKVAEPSAPVEAKREPTPQPEPEQKPEQVEDESAKVMRAIEARCASASVSKAALGRYLAKIRVAGAPDLAAVDDSDLASVLAEWDQHVKGIRGCM